MATTEELWFNEWEFRRPGDNRARDSRGVTLPCLPIRTRFASGRRCCTFRMRRRPTLVIHSQKDYRLDVSEGFQLFTALQRLGVPSEMLYFPDEGHWVLKPKNAELCE